MSSIDPVDLRIQELAAGYALGDLSDAELLEIKSFDPKMFQVMTERSDETAARTFLTLQANTPTEPMPADLTTRLRNMANGFFVEGPANSRSGDALVTKSVAPSTMSLREVTAWLCMAASIAAALCIWLPGKRELTVQQQRDVLLASAADVVRSKWETPTPDSTQGTERGEVVWSTVAQQGYMTIRGLAVNDATQEQYQLWIIDPSRDEKPIDGGVFNIVDATESIVPIRAKLQVNKPTVFAITVEKPGGVVVSDQKRLPLLAKVSIN